MIAKFKSLTFDWHVRIAIILRVNLIIYGEFQDAISEVQYTDIDYKVVTDGAVHVLNGRSPFARHTYRYSPILAYLVIPNALLHPIIGKLIFSFFDILVGILIKKIVQNESEETFIANFNAVSGGKHRNPIKLPEKYVKWAEWSSLIWLYNPLTMIIATRGNSDSFSSLLVLLSVYFLLHPAKNGLQFLLSGIFHGLAIHCRLYPIVFSLPYYLTLTTGNSLLSYLLPNRNKIILVLSTISTLGSLTYLFYHLYGYQFLYESFIYHLVRKDTRHNFSLYFYMQYLTADSTPSILEKILTFLPQLIVLLVLIFKFGYHRKTLPFCLFAQAFTMVTYNPVVTSQYFVWFLSLLPLCVKNFKRLGVKTGIVYALIWFLGQCGWLLPAYFLEFKGWNTFDFIWLQGVLFFSANIYILQRLITNFDVVSSFKKVL